MKENSEALTLISHFERNEVTENDQALTLISHFDPSSDGEKSVCIWVMSLEIPLRQTTDRNDEYSE